MPTIDNIPGLEPDIRDALLEYKRNVEAHYGPILKGIYLFGSRAKGTHRTESDADLAIILDKEISVIGTFKELADYQFSIFRKYGLEIQVWPLRLGSLENPDQYWAPPISRTVAREGILL